MRPEIQHLVRQVLAEQTLDLQSVSQFSPQDFRESIQWLVAQDKTTIALALADAGLSLYPNNEEILAIAGLLAMTVGEWPHAIELLQNLCTLQQESTQPMTYHMLVRALRCNLDITEAHQVLTQGLKAWPQDPNLLSELSTIPLAENSIAATSASNH